MQDHVDNATGRCQWTDKKMNCAFDYHSKRSLLQCILSISTIPLLLTIISSTVYTRQVGPWL